MKFKNYYAENRYKSIENARLRRGGIYLAFRWDQARPLKIAGSILIDSDSENAEPLAPKPLQLTAIINWAHYSS